MSKKKGVSLEDNLENYKKKGLTLFRNRSKIVTFFGAKYWKELDPEELLKNSKDFVKTVNGIHTE